MTSPQSTVEEKETGIASVVYQAQVKPGTSTNLRYVAIKSASSRRRFSPEPHDIVKEISLLKGVSHINVGNI